MMWCACSYVCVRACHYNMHVSCTILCAVLKDKHLWWSVMRRCVYISSSNDLFAPNSIQYIIVATRCNVFEISFRPLPEKGTDIAICARGLAVGGNCGCLTTCGAPPLNARKSLYCHQIGPLECASRMCVAISVYTRIVLGLIICSPKRCTIKETLKKYYVF